VIHTKLVLKTLINPDCDCGYAIYLTFNDTKGSFIMVRSYSQPILRLGGLRSVLLKMYNFYARFIEYKCVDPIVLLDFEDIRIFCNF